MLFLTNVNVKCSISNYETFENGKEIASSDMNASKFSMDVSFAIGFEYNIKSSYDREVDIDDRASSHYIGLRLGYNLNAISPLKDIKHDNLSVSFTYRYLINRRWHGMISV